MLASVVLLEANRRDAWRLSVVWEVAIMLGVVVASRIVVELCALLGAKLLAPKPSNSFGPPRDQT